MDGKFFDREALEELSKEGVTLVSWSNIWASFVSLVKVIDLACTHAVGLQIHWCSLRILKKGNICANINKPKKCSPRSHIPI